MLQTYEGISRSEFLGLIRKARIVTAPVQLHHNCDPIPLKVTKNDLLDAVREAYAQERFDCMFDSASKELRLDTYGAMD